MAQLIVTQTVGTTQDLQTYVNGLTNGWTDVLSVLCPPTGGYVVISKA